MTASNQAASNKLVWAHEGGYVDHPRDPGGPTNKGVTQAVYDAYRVNKGQVKRSVKLIQQAELSEIYDVQYWDAVKADKLPSGLDYAVYDYAVNSGASRAIKDLQRTLNSNASYFGVSGKLTVDGQNGNSTIAAACAAAAIDEESIITAYCERRLSFLKSLKTWGDFGKGWTRRVMGDKDGMNDGDSGVIDYAVAMARNDLTYPLRTRDLPTAVGAKPGEINAKGSEASTAALKTSQGLGSALAAAGAGGQTLIATAEQIKPHIGETLIGRVALVGFIVLILTGVGLVAFDWYRKQAEKAS